MSREAGIKWAKGRAPLTVLGDIADAADSPGRVCELIRSNLADGPDCYDYAAIQVVVDIAKAIDHPLIRVIV